MLLHTLPLVKSPRILQKRHIQHFAISRKFPHGHLTSHSHLNKCPGQWASSNPKWPEIICLPISQRKYYHCQKFNFMSYSMANHVKFFEIEICTNVVLVETILVKENGKCFFNYPDIFFNVTWCAYNRHRKSPSPFWSLSKFCFYEGHEY